MAKGHPAARANGASGRRSRGSTRKVLPLLQFVSGQYQDVRFEKTLVIACQHILGTTYDFFEELFAKGLIPKNVFLIGKCYSTNKETFGLFKKRGVRVSASSFAFDSRVSFDEQFQLNIERFFREIQSAVDVKSFERIIILDDGGCLIVFSNDFLKGVKHAAGVEQTTSGYEKIKTLALRFPVINVARSRAKLEVESPFIAEIAARKIDEYVRKYRIKNPKTLVLGMGYVGAEMYGLLKEKYDVSGCDIIRKRCDFGGDYKSRLGDFDLIVGATGTYAIQPGEFGGLKQGALLASLSSSDREFSAVYLRQLAPRTGECHKDIKAKGVTLLNCGFPVNFNDGKRHSVAAEKIQLTHSLLLAGVLEASHRKFPNKLVDLNSALQDRIVREFRFLSRRAGGQRSGGV
jgi:S-adenosylhomocysteine hydrolase